MSSSVSLRIGDVTLFDGVGVFARGDALLVAYGADASLQRTRFLHAMVEEFVDKAKLTDLVVLMVIPSATKPPDQATRAADAAGYSRLISKVRRLVVVPEGSGFRASLVRMVISAFVTITGKQHVLVITPNVEQGFERIQQVRSDVTPGVERMSADLSALRAALATSYPQRSSLRSLSWRGFSK